MQLVLGTLDWAVLCLSGMSTHLDVLVIGSFLDARRARHVRVLTESRSELALSLVCGRDLIVLLVVVLLINVECLDLATVLRLLSVLHIRLSSLRHQVILTSGAQGWRLVDHAEVVLHHVYRVKLLGVASLTKSRAIYILVILLLVHKELLLHAMLITVLLHYHIPVFVLGIHLSMRHRMT